MPVLGAVLYLEDDIALKNSALRFLGNHPKITLGQEKANRLPVVLESETRDEEKQIWAELQVLPGVNFCSVVFADFSDLNLEESA